MTKSTFLHEMKGRGVTFGNKTLWAKPCELVDNDTGERIRFKNVEDAYEHAEVFGRPLKEIVEESSLADLFGVNLDDSSLMFCTPEEAEKYLY